MPTDREDPISILSRFDEAALAALSAKIKDPISELQKLCNEGRLSDLQPDRRLDLIVAASLVISGDWREAKEFLTAPYGKLQRIDEDLWRGPDRVSALMSDTQALRKQIHHWVAFSTSGFA